MIILALITLIGTLAIGILSVNRILIMERGFRECSPRKYRRRLR
ncbi:hypothetical protein [Roseburia hominis]|nr:hypothetical protein [Roseburia hominis]